MEFTINPQAVRAAPTLDLPPAVLVGALEAIRATGSGQLPGAGLPRDRFAVAERLEALGYGIAWADESFGMGFEVVTLCGLYLVANGRAGNAWNMGRRQKRLEAILAAGARGIAA